MPDAIRERAPHPRELLSVHRTVWGEPIVREGALGPDILSPVYTSTARHDPVTDEVARLKLRIVMPDRKIRDVDLTPDEFDAYVETAGQIAKSRVSFLMNLAGWSRLPDDARLNMVMRTIRDAREAARAAMLQCYPDLARRVAEAEMRKAS